ncbi:hypothetical protein PHPALM_28415 [Phytophthora palmivora]|uniref:Uncharacterized protein n=1 Tax=Phytophthora palmivora TaxID=4796 RepID=A0A2P4XA53_9STRA|nr:hypothetical protein PHPALM_28415 [Phytophthora palmivora]
MLIDNTIALSRLNKLSSRHPIARTYKRLISLSEFVHGFTCIAKHIPADGILLRTRGREPGARIIFYMCKFSRHSKKFWKVWEAFSVETLSLIRRPEHTPLFGVNGAKSLASCGGYPGYHDQDDRRLGN